MIAEISANNRANEVYRLIGMHVTGRTTLEGAGKAGSIKLPAFLKKRKRA